MRDLSVLSDVEFEELAADLLAAELGRPVERFGVGRDGGIDLRWSNPKSRGHVIGQCKHYLHSTFAQLRAAARRELDHVKELDPAGYKFLTTYDLTVGQKTVIYQIFEPWMDGVDDVVGGRDIDGLLTRHKSVERRHAKLWISTGSQLFWATHSELANRASALQEDVAQALPRYVAHDGYEKARKILDTHRVCVIAGVPGIGKTMLAYVLLADAMSAGYEPVEVSGDIDEAWTALRPDEPQVFLYDDFLGQLSFAERMGRNEDSRLASFIDRIRRLKSTMLILTTREYVLQDARLTYGRLKKLEDRMEFILQLSDYTRSNRARILYNHLWQADLSEDALREVADGGYREIVDHANYSPRLIEYGTGPAFDTQSPGYVLRFRHALDHPSELWETAFERHLDLEQRLLAVSLATMPSPAPLDDLKRAHSALCRELSVSTTAATFRSALRVMEGTFIAVGVSEGAHVIRFHNPSIREFVLDWLAADHDLVRSVIESAAHFEQLQQMHAYATGSHGTRFGTAGRAPLEIAMKTSADAFTNALKRTIESDCPEYRTEWDHDEGQVRRRRSNWYESRLSFLIGLNEPWRPGKDWIAEVVARLGGRWQGGEGWKADAVKLMRQLEELGASGDDLIADSSVEDVSRILDEWLTQDLNETETDWGPYLTRLQESGVELLTRDDLAEQFADFATEELGRWSPAPPHLDELRSYAEEFGLSDLMLELDEAGARESARDDYESSRIADRPRSGTITGAAEGGSDSDLDQLFSRLRT